MGAFVANIDGPVRAIRAYIGANSGPLTQRTHLMYRDREDIVTDLRVHAIPAVMDFMDYSTGAIGMTYRSSTTPAGVTIDGTNDTVSATLPTWDSVDGAPGSIMTHNVLTTSVGGLTVGQFYRDQTSPPEAQCWGDGSLLGASGPSVGAVPNTDPRTNPFSNLQVRRIVQFGPPSSDPSQIPALAADWAADIDQPLTTATSAVG